MSLVKLALSVDYALRFELARWCCALPGYRLRRWVFVRVAQGEIGRHSWIQRGLRLFCLGGIRIGDYTTINPDCWLDGRSGLTIGSNVQVSIGTRILTMSHDPQDPDFTPKEAAVTIGDYAWLGAWCLILPGVSVGEGGVVGAGAVVTRDVAPYTIVAGNPAREIKKRSQSLRYQIEWTPLWQ